MQLIMNHLVSTMQPQKKQLVLSSMMKTISFHSAMKFSIQLAQLFSCFPIYVGGDTYESLKFSWKYWRVAYNGITCFFFILEFFLVLYQSLTLSLNLLDIKTLIFHLGGLIHIYLFFKLTMVWPTYVKEWHTVEVKMRNYGITSSLVRKLNIITTSIMIVAGVEHGLVNAYKLKKTLEAEETFSKGLENYFVHTYTHIFDVLGYSVWLGSLIQFMNLQRTFNWSYADVFIMLFGSAITYRLKQLTKQIQHAARLKVNDLKIWKTVRKDYVRIAALCQLTNELLSSTIVVCFLLNLYFVLIQLFNSLGRIDNIVAKVYFYLSFGLLLLRVTCVCIFGGAVHQEWQNIAFSLNSVQSSGYNIEVERFIYHVSSIELGLSGKNFFKITRGLILKMAGAIVTYELVFIQFYAKK